MPQTLKDRLYFDAVDYLSKATDWSQAVITAAVLQTVEDGQLVVLRHVVTHAQALVVGDSQLQGTKPGQLKDPLVLSLLRSGLHQRRLAAATASPNDPWHDQRRTWARDQIVAARRLRNHNRKLLARTVVQT